MTHVIRVVVAVAVAMGSAGSLHAQSLGAVARKEEARRKQVANPAKVYTNENLKGSDRSDGTATAAPANNSAAASTEQPPEAETAPAGETAKRDEKYWHERMAGAKDSLERARTFEEALQTRVNALNADFTSRDDPAQRQVVASNRQKSLDELSRVKKEIAGFEKQIRDTEEEARRAGVPAGWLR